MCQVGVTELKKHCIEDTSGYPDHAFPAASHVGRVRRVKDPGAALVTNVPSDA